MPILEFRRLRQIAGSQAVLPALLVIACAFAPPGAEAAPMTANQAVAKRVNSTMDGELFYQLFLSELELVRGEPGVAYQVILEAARRNKDDALFQRAVDVAIGARAGEQALSAAKTWRATVPKSRRAAEVQAQLFMALGKPADASDALRAMIELSPEAERLDTIAQLPRMVVAGQGTPAAATAVDDALKAWRAQPATRAAALVSTARSWAIAGNTGKAWESVREVLKADAGSEAAATVALDLFSKERDAEAAILGFLQARPAAHAVRLGYARRLTSAQRYTEALKNTQSVTAVEPTLASAWLLEGALQIELGNPRAAQAALTRYLAVSQSPRGERPAAASDVEEDGPGAPGNERADETAQAYLMLAQAAEQLKDYSGAQAWLDKLGEAQTSPLVLTRRATLLARQGKVKEARALIQTLPDRNAEEARAKILGETQLLRDVRAWGDAYEVLSKANERLPDDTDLLYEQALISERLERFDEMERLLRRVIAIKPDQHHAYNALGYSLADRNLRLIEARQLIQRALDLAPGDPFITDSLAWAEYRLGQKDAALALLRQAYGRRPDTEIGAHLGEVLWSVGQADEARRIWRISHERDASNDVLKETLTRLKVKL